MICVFGQGFLGVVAASQTVLKIHTWLLVFAVESGALAAF